MDKSDLSVSTAITVSSVTIIFDLSSSLPSLRIDGESKDKAIPGRSGMNACNLLDIDSALFVAPLLSFTLDELRTRK